MTDVPTPRLDAFLAAQRLHDEFDGWSVDEIERLPFDQYRRLRERAGLPPVDAQVPGTAVQVPEPASAAETHDTSADISAMPMSQYKRYREQIGMGRSASARGIFGHTQ